MNDHVKINTKNDFMCPNNDLPFNDTLFNFITFMDYEVYNALLSIKSNAVGDDGVHLRFIKIIIIFILPYITHIFNHIITTSSYPRSWKIAKITAVAKSNMPINPEDFRPVSILSSLSKVFEKLLSIQILHHISSNKLMAANQSGFQAGKSCNTAVP